MLFARRSHLGRRHTSRIHRRPCRLDSLLPRRYGTIPRGCEGLPHWLPKRTRRQRPMTAFQPNLCHQTSIRPKPRQDGRSDTTNASLFWALLSIPWTSASVTPREVEPCKETRDPSRSRPVCSYCPLSFFAFASAAVRSATTPTRRPQKASASADVPNEMPWRNCPSPPPLWRRGSQRTSSPQKRRFRQQGPRPPFLLLPSWPRAAAQTPFAVAFWPDHSDVSAAKTQFRRNIREDARRVICPTSVIHTLWTFCWNNPPEEPESLELHQVPGAGAWLVGGTRSPLFGWDADFVRTTVQHRLRIPFSDEDSQCSSCGQVLARFCDRAAVCPFARDRNVRHNGFAHVFCEAGQTPPGDLLQNLVQTSVTKALIDLGHVMDPQDEPEEVDGEKITQSNRKHNMGARGTIPKGQDGRKSYEEPKTQPR